MRGKAFLIGLVVSVAVLAASAPAFAARTLHPAIYYVNDDASGLDKGTSWQDAFTDLQSALNAAVSGDQIWVAAGTYKPSSADRTAPFNLKSGVAVYGGFAGNERSLDKRSLDASATVLSGDIGTAGDDADNSYHVVYADGVTGAVLDGFTVTGGRSALTGTLANTAGAGMYTSNSVLTVADCIFSNNWARGGTACGGGMYNLNSALTIARCTFNRNQTGGDIPPYSYADGSGAPGCATAAGPVCMTFTATHYRPSSPTASSPTTWRGMAAP